MCSKGQLATQVRLLELENISVGFLKEVSRCPARSRYTDLVSKAQHRLGLSTPGLALPSGNNGDRRIIVRFHGWVIALFVRISCTVAWPLLRFLEGERRVCHCRKRETPAVPAFPRILDTRLWLGPDPALVQSPSPTHRDPRHRAQARRLQTGHSTTAQTKKRMPSSCVTEDAPPNSGRNYTS